MNLDCGKLGISTFFDAMAHEEAVDFAQRVEALGYDTLWFPEIVSREVFHVLEDRGYSR